MKLRVITNDVAGSATCSLRCIQEFQAQSGLRCAISDYVDYVLFEDDGSIPAYVYREAGYLDGIASAADVSLHELIDALLPFGDDQA